MEAERIRVQPLRHLDLAQELVIRKRGDQCAAHLRWVKPELLGNQYELRSSERTLGTMTIRGFYHPSATGEGADGCWTIEPLGSGTGKIVVRNSDSLCDVAVFDMSFSDHGGMLRIPDGRVLVLQSDFWKGFVEFQTPAGEPVIRFRFHGLLRPSAEMEILGEGRRMTELPWILMLGWCFIVGYS
jgi:hypothetical protein